MGLQLNIKDAETVRLARELAKQLDKSVTETVRDALRDRAASYDAGIAQQKAQVHQTVADIRHAMPAAVKGVSSKELMDPIYVDGLPE